MKRLIRDNYNKITNTVCLTQKFTRPENIMLVAKKMNSFVCTARKNGIRVAIQKAKNFIRIHYKPQLSSVSNPNWSPAQQYIGSNGIPANSYESHYEDEEDFSQYKTDIKALAFYLPQFHSFPENDEWWGKGFTEWTNTRKATPQYPSHYQPREPHDDIGYYDLSDWRVLKKQAELAKQHGIYGFCIYHYWFSGKRLMEKPVDLLMEHPEIDLNFCLCWANENWTRTWDGLDNEVLIDQKHEDDDLDYIRDLKKYIMDSRYIRIDGKPLIVVYRPGILPDAQKTFQRWRKWAKNNGIGEILIWIVRGCSNSPASMMIRGADGEIEFPPGYSTMPQVLKNTEHKGQILNYPAYVNDICASNGCVEKYPHPVYRGVMLGWDCAARRKSFHGWYGFSPGRYYKWMRYLIDYTRNRYAEHERFIFINAWNEWAEGTYLEPDKLFGYTNINTTSRALFDLPFKEKLTEEEEMQLILESGFYDEQWYTQIYSDITAAGMVPLFHYAMTGWKEGRSPSERFPGALYLMFNPHLLSENLSPIADYCLNGRQPEYLEHLCKRFDNLQKDSQRKLKIERIFLDTVTPAKENKAGKTAIHLHLFYEDMIPKICNYLKSIPRQFDLLVSIPEQYQSSKDRVYGAFIQQLPQLNKCLIKSCPNRGRDIAPMLCSFNKQLKEYDYFCHIHTKKSLHTPAHNKWADFIYSYLFGDKSWNERIFTLLESGEAGIIYPPDFLTMREEPCGWGSNLEYAQHFIKDTLPGIDLKNDFPVIEFPQGSMFWAKTSYLTKLLDQEFNYSDFPDEPLGTDGSLLHALERLFFIWGMEKPEKIYQVFHQDDKELMERKRYWFKM